MPEPTLKVVHNDDVLYEGSVHADAIIKLESTEEEGVTSHVVEVTTAEPEGYIPPGTPKELSTAGQVSVAAGDTEAKDIPPEIAPPEVATFSAAPASASKTASKKK